MADGDILILESFDRYAETGTVGRMNSIWSENMALVPGRYFGGKGVSYASDGSNNGGQVFAYTNNRVTSFTMGMAFKPDYRNQTTICAINGPEGIISLGHYTNGRLMAVRRGWGNFGFGSQDLMGDGNKVDAVVAGVWQYVEFQIVETDGAIGNVKAWVNGELCMDLVGAGIYRPSGFDGFGVARGANQGAAQYDDFYVRQGPTRLGEIKIESIIPDGTISNTLPVLVGAASAHLAVSENPVDGDASYVSGDTAGQGVRYSMGNLTNVPDAIRAVQVRAYARKDETAYRSIKNAVLVAGTTAKGQEQVLGTGFKFFRDIFPVNPATGQAWTKAAIDGFACGVDIEV